MRRVRWRSLRADAIVGAAYVSQPYDVRTLSPSRSIHQKGPRPVTSRSNPPAVRTAPGKQQSRPEGKAVKAAAPKESWRRALKPGDEGEVQKWVEQSGLERVARIIASLANARVEVGRTERPDSLLLLKMAFLVRERPERSLHSIAIEGSNRLGKPDVQAAARFHGAAAGLAFVGAQPRGPQ
jgi:hypothetical protein